MKIICDDSIYAAQEFLGPLAGSSDELSLVPAQEMLDQPLERVEVFVTRTVLRIDETLLERAPALRMVASVSAGFDHVDREALNARGVHFAHAPGCNALAVAQWVVAAWTRRLESQDHVHRSKARVGVIGHGEVGGRVAAFFRLLGHEVWCCDPPRARGGEDPSIDYRPLTDLLEGCQMLTLHVPLTREGEDKTEGLLRRAAVTDFLARGGAIINTSRGDTLELPATIPAGSAMIVDVWPGEPNPPWDWIVQHTASERLYATPHIAGYSAEAKLRGTSMVADAIAAFVGLERHEPSFALPDLRDHSSALHELSALTIDHERLVQTARAFDAAAPMDAAAAFSRSRREYAHRREWVAYAGHFEPGGSLEPYKSLLAVL